MSAFVASSRPTDLVIDHYVDTRRGYDRPISTSQAVVAIRSALPGCLLTDRELSDLVAASAIRRGRNVAFDLPG